MTKYEWDRRLRKSLKELPADERQRVFEYYDELFEDKIDSGEKEEAVVARFGEPEAAARKILADYNAYLGRDEYRRQRKRICRQSRFRKSPSDARFLRRTRYGRRFGERRGQSACNRKQPRRKRESASRPVRRKYGQFAV